MTTSNPQAARQACRYQRTPKVRNAAQSASDPKNAMPADRWGAKGTSGDPSEEN